MKGSFAILCFFVLAIISCARSKNYKDAYRVTVNDRPHVKLFGERRYMTHDPISLIFNGTYKDSAILPLPLKNDGVLKGDDIPTKAGYYKFKGTIMLKGQDVRINLLIDNIDDKTLHPYIWNGTYSLR